MPPFWERCCKFVMAPCSGYSPEASTLFGSLWAHIIRAAAFTARFIHLLLFQLKSGALTFKREKSQRFTNPLRLTLILQGKHKRDRWQHKTWPIEMGSCGRHAPVVRASIYLENSAFSLFLLMYPLSPWNAAFCQPKSQCVHSVPASLQRRNRFRRGSAKAQRIFYDHRHTLHGGVEGFCFGPGSPGTPANINAACSLWQGFLFQMICMVPHDLCGTNAIIALIIYTLRPSFVPVWQCQHRNTLICWKFVRVALNSEKIFTAPENWNRRNIYALKKKYTFYL